MTPTATVLLIEDKLEVHKVSFLQEIFLDFDKIRRLWTMVVQIVDTDFLISNGNVIKADEAVLHLGTYRV